MNRGKATDAILESTLDGTERLILFGYIKCQNSAAAVDVAVSYPGIETLALYAGCGVTAARQARQRLLASGVLVHVDGATGDYFRCRIDPSKIVRDVAFDAPRKRRGRPVNPSGIRTPPENKPLRNPLQTPPESGPLPLRNPDPIPLHDPSLGNPLENTTPPAHAGPPRAEPGPQTGADHERDPQGRPVPHEGPNPSPAASLGGGAGERHRDDRSGDGLGAMDGGGDLGGVGAGAGAVGLLPLPGLNVDPKPPSDVFIVWAAYRQAYPLAGAMPSKAGQKEISSALRAGYPAEDLVALVEWTLHAPHPRAHYMRGETYETGVAEGRKVAGDYLGIENLMVRKTMDTRLTWAREWIAAGRPDYRDKPAALARASPRNGASMFDQLAAMMANATATADADLEVIDA